MTALGPQSPNYTTARPATDPNVSGTGVDTWFKDCSAPGAADGTIVTASWLNVVTAQLRTAIQSSGVVLDNANDAMLYQAIQAEVAASMAALTGSTGVKRVGDDIQLALGDGSQTSLLAAGIDPLSDKINVFDASGAVISEASIYQAIKATLSTSTGVLFDDATGAISFAAPRHTVASAPPAAPNLRDTWYDSDDDILYERTTDGVTPLWIQIA